MTISPNKWELDVQGYLNTCNISAATPRQQIRDFAKGVNDLGLWNSMVCWPLRSSQNYGSGTTAFSLGGLGTFNGTLVNGPTWGADALDFTVDNSAMNTAIALPVAPVALVVVHKAQEAQSNNDGVYFTAGIGVDGRQFTSGNTSSITNQDFGTARDTWYNAAFVALLNDSSLTRTSREYNAFRILSSSAARVSRNLQQSSSDIAVTGWDTSSPANVKYGYYPKEGANDTLSFMAHFTAAIDNTTDAAFYSLYKQTLGQGLTGLP